jgi:hypothetical protein
MNAKQRRVFRRGIDRHMDAILDSSEIGQRIPLCRRLRELPGFWVVLDRCEVATGGDDGWSDDPWDDFDDGGWDDDQEDEDGPWE